MHQREFYLRPAAKLLKILFPSVFPHIAYYSSMNTFTFSFSYTTPPKSSKFSLQFSLNFQMCIRFLFHFKIPIFTLYTSIQSYITIINLIFYCCGSFLPLIFPLFYLFTLFFSSGAGNNIHLLSHSFLGSGVWA